MRDPVDADRPRRSTRRQLLGALAGIGLPAVAGAAPGVRRGGEPPPSVRFLDAVARGDAALVGTLLDADPGLLHARDPRGRSAFALALLERHPEVAALLRARGHRPDLHEAALALDWEGFEALAARTPGAVDLDHPIGGTAMYAAAVGGAGSEMWRVYAQGGEPDARSRDAGAPTPLRAALDHPDLATAELTAATLLANGADADAPQPGGRSALHVAAERGSVELAEMLVRKGADPEARDADGRTALQAAQRAGAEDVARLLRDHRAIPRDRATSRRAFDGEGRPYRQPDLSAFDEGAIQRMVGVSHFDLDEVRRRVDAHPELAHAVATTTEGAVEACAHTGRSEIVDLLLERGAPCSLPTAVMRGDTKRVRSLLAEDPRRIHERGAHDFALLWYPVIGGGLLDLAALLLDAGAEIERQHHLGTTALHWAAMRGQVEMAALLLERGADPGRAGRKFSATPETPLDLALRGGHAEVAGLLRARGARA